MISTTVKNTLLGFATAALALAGPSGAAEQKQFALHKGGIEPLIQAADSFMKNFNKDLQATVSRRNSEQEEGVSLVYYVVVEPPAGSPPFITAEKRTQATIGITIHKPRTARAGKFITEGPEAERVALSYAFQRVLDLFKQTPKALILENNVPAGYVNLTKSSPKDPRFDLKTGLVIPPGSYFFYRAKDSCAATAANVDLHVLITRTNYDKADSEMKRPEAADVMKTLLDQLPTQSAVSPKPTTQKK